MSFSPSILVIDDEPNNFDVIEALLFSEGYQLDYASNGFKALERLETNQPDVILLDVMMPDLDGIELCHRIKANLLWRSIPIIMVTSLNSKEDLSRCLAAGADDFVSKPVNGSELKARVNSMLRIKQQYDDLRALLQLREDMVHMIVHDLRNPLASILMATEILKIPGLSPEKQRWKMDQISIAGHQLQSLIDSLLLLAKLESGKMVLNRTEVDLCEIFISVLADFEAIAAQKNLQLISELPEPGGSASIDIHVFRRILDNLLSNAIKFSPKNSQIVVKANYLDNGGAKVQVEDLGPGVSEEMQQSIFEKYEIGTLIKGVSQTGLGLAFCKIAIEAHDGRIMVEKNHPKGAIFTVEVGSGA